ncbi:hypothetical protein E4U50_006319 [Claviceps purpurea]|nr:hypothetical protein E4U50_006319 [Claviceps purpurea]
MSVKPTLEAFLATARNALRVPPAQRPKPLTFVVGNESADLDSLCSAVVYAFIRTNSAPYALHIPLANLPRADLAMRTEMTAVLQHAALTPEQLLTLTELPDPQQLQPHQDTHWVLVDHNSPTSPVRELGGQITGCVDHHVDEAFVDENVQPRVIEPCGSCMSLIVDECRPAWQELRKQMEAAEHDKLIKLCLAPILLDTANMTATFKVRPKDTRAVEFLQQQMHDQTFDASQYHDQIHAVQEDISALCFRDILRKDYKEWQEGGLTLGISCVVRGFEFLLEKAGSNEQVLLRELSSWAENRSLDVAAVMTASYPGGQFRRQLLLWGLNARGIRAVKTFRERSTQHLKLSPWHDGLLDRGEERFAWVQLELAASRKQVAPLLREALRLSSSEDEKDAV